MAARPTQKSKGDEASSAANKIDKLNKQGLKKKRNDPKSCVKVIKMATCIT